MTKGSGGFKNQKLGKNVYRQLRRRGDPQPIPDRSRKSDHSDKPKGRPRGR